MQDGPAQIIKTEIIDEPPDVEKVSGRKV